MSKTQNSKSCEADNDHNELINKISIKCLKHTCIVQDNVWFQICNSTLKNLVKLLHTNPLDYNIFLNLNTSFS